MVSARYSILSTLPLHPPATHTRLACTCEERWNGTINQNSLRGQHVNRSIAPVFASAIHASAAQSLLSLLADPDPDRSTQDLCLPVASTALDVCCLCGPRIRPLSTHATAANMHGSAIALPHTRCEHGGSRHSTESLITPVNYEHLPAEASHSYPQTSVPA